MDGEVDVKKRGRQTEGRLSQPAAKKLLQREEKQPPRGRRRFLPPFIRPSFFFLLFLFHPFFYSSLSIHYQTNPFIFAP